MQGPIVSFNRSPDGHLIQSWFAGGGPDWLFRLFVYRWLADIPPLSPTSSGWNIAEDPTLSSQDLQLANWELANHIYDHLDDQQSNPNYDAAQQSNLYFSLQTNVSPTDPIDTWMAGVFHGLPMINPQLTSVGFAMPSDAKQTPPYYQTIAALNVRANTSGTTLATPTQPVMWPANGRNCDQLTTYAPELPDARSMFGYLTSIGLDPQTWPAAGVPIFLQLGMQSPTVSNVASTSDPTVTGVTGFSLALNGNDLGSGNYVQIDEFNYNYADSQHPTWTSTGQKILHAQGAVVLLPKQPLVPGTYTVSITVNGMLYLWSFTIQVNGPICLSYVGPQSFSVGQPFQGTFKAMAPLDGLIGGPYTFDWQQSPPPGDMGLTLTPSADGYSLSLSGTAALPSGFPQGYTWAGPLMVSDIYYQQPTSFPVNIQVLP